MEVSGEDVGRKSKSVCREFYEKFPLGGERTPEKLVAFLESHPSSRTKLDEWLKSADSENTHGPTTKYSKCNSTSRRERELGNAHFKGRNLKKSLHHYNNAVKFAEFTARDGKIDVHDGGDTEACLAIALANRSAVYAELGDTFHDKALQDADLAVKFGYPERLKSKILFRKTAIHIKKRDVKSAKECLDEIKKTRLPLPSYDKNVSPFADLCPEASSSRDMYITGGNTVDNKIPDLEIQIGKLQQDGNTLKQDTEESHADFSENQNFANASSDLEINFEMGRNVVSKDNIAEGELLFREEPFASVLLPEFYYTHCHHCHMQLLEYDEESYFIPCRGCTQIMFCSYECSQAAQLYHINECGWLDLLHSVGIAHLALRIILVAGLDDILHCVRNHEALTSHTSIDIFKMGCNNYHRVYSLVDHISDMFEEDLFQYTLTASLLTRFLQTKAGFFEGVGENERMKVGGALLRHICQLIFNAHAITAVLPDSESNERESCPVVDEYQKRIATAIYPSASIMNHSCDPNISFYFEQGKLLLVTAARPIGLGESVYNCYGPHFRRMSRPNRQEILLQQYFFNCSCNKCTIEKEQGVSFADQFSAFKCESCEGPVSQNQDCPHCGSPKNKKTSSGMYSVVCELQKKGQYLLNRNEFDKAIEAFESCYIAAAKVLFKHNSQLGEICDSLARCYVAKGNRKNAQQYLDFSMEYVEQRFGKKSVEYSRELKKYEDLESLTQSVS